ncbi:CYFIP-related Rac1 interactor A isoform X1 [Kogia breviceps]|uniref:CYFIP-related Rac1 interactor A isoform X1 n=1 Tax=Kogia breviceps TaxID=27615 RepID=UPI0034D26CAD
MGNLLKVLTREIENYPHFFLDFENAQPTEGEREIWNQISAVLQDSESILADLQAYKGAGPEIRDAIQNPNDIQLQEKAWNAVCPLVVRLKRFYEFSIRLEKALQSLLESLTCPPYTPTQHLEREQALAKEFAEILHFTLRFDELKMRNPAIQNDFSYYRRTISRNRINNMHLDIENEVNNEMANRMSLFYAEATPMLKTLSNATMHFVSENKTLPIENTTDCLSTMTSVCKVMLETPEYRSRFTSEETLMFCMRVMVGVIILYDHVHPVGAFCKTSKIDVRIVTNCDFPIRAHKCRQTDLASLSPSPPRPLPPVPGVNSPRCKPRRGSSPPSKKSSPVHMLAANTSNLKGTAGVWRCRFPQPVEELRDYKALRSNPKQRSNFLSHHPCRWFYLIPVPFLVLGICLSPFLCPERPPSTLMGGILLRHCSHVTSFGAHLLCPAWSRALLLLRGQSAYHFGFSDSLMDSEFVDKGRDQDLDT